MTSTPSFSLATLMTPERERAAIVTQGNCYRLDRISADPSLGSVRAMLEHWEDSLALLTPIAQRCANSGRDSPAFVAGEQVVFATPIKYPNKLLCVGAAYKGHLLEMDLPATRWAQMPFFIRPPTTSLVGPGKTVCIPPMTQQFDWEVELAVVVGRRLKDASNEEAAAGVAGYSVGIDLTCRDLIDRNSPLGVDLVRAKSQDGMAPVGPVLQPARFVGDPQQLTLKLSVNGEVKQNGSTSDMLYPVCEQLSTISRYITLEPGDIVLTGSPAGSGASIGQFLKPGDRIRAEISGVGVLDIEVFASS